MTAKEYLQQAYWLEGYIWSLIEQRERLKDQQTKITSIMTGMPAAGSTGDKVGGSSVAMVDLENRIDDTVRKQRVLQAEVLQKINGLESVEYKMILVHRYINFKKWYEVARAMRYSRMHIHRLHTAALIVFEDKYLNGQDSGKMEVKKSGDDKNDDA